MTFDGAIELALRDLGLGTTEFAHEQYDDRFLQYANAAVLELSKDCRPVAVDETVAAVDGKFSIASLTHAVYQLIRVRDDNREYHTEELGGIVTVCQPITGNVKVTYEYYYEPAVLKTESIPLPAQYHQLVPIYVAAQFLLDGDKAQQQIATNKLQLFSAMRRSLRKPHIGSTASYKLTNMGW